MLNFDEQEDLHENDERDKVAQEGKKWSGLTTKTDFQVSCQKQSPENQVKLFTTDNFHTLRLLDLASFFKSPLVALVYEWSVYLNKFYKCHMHESRPTEFCFKILPGQSEFYVNQVLD